MQAKVGHHQGNGPAGSGRRPQPTRSGLSHVLAPVGLSLLGPLGGRGAKGEPKERQEDRKRPRGLGAGRSRGGELGAGSWELGAGSWAGRAQAGRLQCTQTGRMGAIKWAACTCVLGALRPGSSAAERALVPPRAGRSFERLARGPEAICRPLLLGRSLVALTRVQRVARVCNSRPLLVGGGSAQIRPQDRVARPIKCKQASAIHLWHEIGPSDIGRRPAGCRPLAGCWLAGSLSAGSGPMPAERRRAPELVCSADSVWPPSCSCPLARPNSRGSTRLNSTRLDSTRLDSTRGPKCCGRRAPVRAARATWPRRRCPLSRRRGKPANSAGPESRALYIKFNRAPEY